MKKILTFTLFIFAAYSCNFNKSINENLSTGMTVVGDGLSYEDVELLVGENVIEKPVFNYGDKLTLQFSGISGFEESNGRYYPGLEMVVKDLDGNELYRLDDLFADSKNGYSVAENTLSASLTLGNPILSGQKYKLSVSIWDKKGKGTLKAKIEFDLQGNDAIEVSGERDFSYDEIYLFSENNEQVIPDNVIAADDRAFLIIDGLTGLEVTDGMVYPVVSFSISDAEGNNLFYSENMFTQYAESGISAEDFGKKITLSYDKSLQEGLSELILHVEIMEQSNEKSMVIDTKLSIE